MKIPQDKLGHMYVGFALAFISYWYSPWTALIFVSTFAIGKEIYDYFHQENHSVEFLDIVATYVGGAIGTLLWLALMYLWNL